MNVVIFSGGSGSHLLQQNMFSKYEDLNVSVITNAYDNGKSTGAIRTVFDGKILGPSDVRKNQTRHYSLKYGIDDVYRFIEHRFTSSTPLEYITTYVNRIRTNSHVEKNILIDKLLAIVERYFKTIPAAANIAYEDFSIGNIIYGMLAFENNYSLQTASDIMKELLDIDQETILNDDESLFLFAKTQSGMLIHDEADIVDYDNAENKIVDIGFLTADGEKREFSYISDRAIEKINSADIIIFSSGTQWSSLIPTYKSVSTSGVKFSQIIENATAEKFLVMNAAEDKDMKDVSATEICNILERYFSLNNVNVITSISKDVPESLQHCERTHIADNISIEGKHTGKLIEIIFNTYFKCPTRDDLFVFDWDDTVVGRKGTFLENSRRNIIEIRNLNSIIVSGNSSKKVQHSHYYADGAGNLYKDNLFVKHVDPKTIITEAVFEKIENIILEFGFSPAILQNRGETCLSIKPIVPQYRKLFLKVISDALPHDYIAFLSGTTTIDITHKNLSKLLAIKDIKENTNKRIFYIGDEYENGNDKIVFDNEKELDITCIKVSTPADTNIFLKSIKGD